MKRNHWILIAVACCVPFFAGCLGRDYDPALARITIPGEDVDRISEPSKRQTLLALEGVDESGSGYRVRVRSGGPPPNWTGGKWTGGQWTGGNWTGGNWTGSNWTGRGWTGSNWTGSNNWSGSNWSGGNTTGSNWTGSQPPRNYTGAAASPRNGNITYRER